MWEFMINGCIPIVDQAPNIHRLGLKEGVHFLSISSFSMEEFNRISNIPSEKLSEISGNAFKFALENLSIKNFNEKYNNFDHHLKNLNIALENFL